MVPYLGAASSKRQTGNKVTLLSQSSLDDKQDCPQCRSFCTWRFQIFFPLLSYLVCLLHATWFSSQHGTHAVLVIKRTIGEQPRICCVSEHGHQSPNELLTCQSKGWWIRVCLCGLTLFWWFNAVVHWWRVQPQRRSDGRHMCVSSLEEAKVWPEASY